MNKKKSKKKKIASTIRQCKNKPKVLEFVELKLPFLPGKEKTHALNYKQNYICKKRDKQAAFVSLKKNVKRSKRWRNQSLPSHLCFASIVYYFYYHYSLFKKQKRCTNAGFVDKGYLHQKPSQKKKTKLYNGTPPVT